MAKTNAEKCRQYREKNKEKKKRVKKAPKSSTERVREFRTRRMRLFMEQQNLNIVQHNASSEQHRDNYLYAEYAPTYLKVETVDSFDNDMLLAPLRDAARISSPIETQSTSCEGSVWIEAATQLLLDNVKQLYGKVGKSSNLKSKTRLWKIIAENLCKEGYNFSPLQVETKFRGLLKQYKKVKLNGSKSGRITQNSVYQSQLDEILGLKTNVTTEYTLDNESPELAPWPAQSNQETLNEAPTTSSAVKDAERKRLLKKLEEILQKKEERHKKLQECLDKWELYKIEKEKEKKQREKRREELGNRIVDLLEKLINKSTE